MSTFLVVRHVIIRQNIYIYLGAIKDVQNDKEPAVVYDSVSHRRDNSWLPYSKFNRGSRPPF